MGIALGMLQLGILKMRTKLAASYIYSLELSNMLKDVIPAIIENHSNVLELYSPLRIEKDTSLDLHQEIQVTEDQVFKERHALRCIQTW